MSKVWEKVLASRDIERAKPMDYVRQILDNIIILKGDRLSAEDPSVTAGIAEFNGIPVTFLANAKGHSAEENMETNFGMAGPEAYRKCIRLIRQAEKFNRPLLTFIDTPGAYPGVEAEEKGQGEAIAQLIGVMQGAKVPSIALITGEGGSGGALCLSMADKILMMENAVYSILSPEGFSTILWKDKSRAEEAAEYMKITAEDLYELNIIDEIVSENGDPIATAKQRIKENLQEIMRQDRTELVNDRKLKFRKMGL